MFVVDALVSGQRGGIGVVARGALAGMAGRDDVLALVPPGVSPPVPHRVVTAAGHRAGRLALQRTGGVLALHPDLRRGRARFVGMDAFSLPVPLPRTSHVVLHDLLPLPHPEYWGPVDRRHKTASTRTAVRRAARIVVASDHNARLLRAVAGRDDAAVAPFGCGQLTDEDADGALRRGPARTRHDRVVVTGALQPRKRLDLLLRAMDRVRRSAGTEPELVVVGDGDPAHVRGLHDLARELALPVTWAGPAPWSRVAELVSTARAVVYPSRHEGFGLPLLEALALGTRPVAANTSALRSWAGAWPSWFAPDDVDDLAAAIVEAVDGASWDGAAAQQAVAHHRWHRFADRLLAPT